MAFAVASSGGAALSTRSAAIRQLLHSPRSARQRANSAHPRAVCGVAHAGLPHRGIDPVGISGARILFARAQQLFEPGKVFVPAVGCIVGRSGKGDRAVRCNNAISARESSKSLDCPAAKGAASVPASSRGSAYSRIRQAEQRSAPAPWSFPLAGRQYASISSHVGKHLGLHLQFASLATKAARSRRKSPCWLLACERL